MAQRIEIIVSCDLCTEPARAALGTYRIADHSGQYEIDLCAEHKVALDYVIAPYRDNARRIIGSAIVRRERNSEAAQMRRDARAWGIANGKPVSAMGRISQAVISEYREYLASRQA